MNRIAHLIDRLRFARSYTEALIRDLDEGLWFRQPAEGVTHITWQIGHITVSQHSLCLRRIHGQRPEDESLIPAGFRELFGKGSTPVVDAAAYPTVDAIRKVFDDVHAAALSVCGDLTDDVLDEAVAPPHPAFSNKFGAIRFAAEHELIHAGQIALLRRLMGRPPLR
ncbi:DinB superfamily protein [Maioricimonas rarisocia]|uniref:DinB superfamily protein n=1 Tax=Maioricimonas rarisocia TaxID=2528026 RepID=A0A517Z2W4_9PLAN|nr:DinB family protein [Maioricimonas rarisocia]QDU36786.1 DinB superfamily protein [Maioricimonas rarisocia]